ncbi:MAG: hypothetical protein K0S82_1865 [Gaiellaceae bacterium]|nr:hypothetical protein [Gaiellaceae bacterium]
MQGGFGPRFALEAGFLIAVAIGAGFAELSATVIVVVMAVAWLLVCLFELAVWAERPRFPGVVPEATVVAEERPGEPDELTDPEPVAAALEQRREAEGG